MRCLHGVFEICPSCQKMLQWVWICDWRKKKGTSEWVMSSRLYRSINKTSWHQWECVDGRWLHEIRCMTFIFRESRTTSLRLFMWKTCCTVRMAKFKAVKSSACVCVYLLHDPVDLAVLGVDLVAHVQGHVAQVTDDAAHLLQVLVHLIFPGIVCYPENTYTHTQGYRSCLQEQQVTHTPHIARMTRSREVLPAPSAISSSRFHLCSFFFVSEAEFDFWPHTRHLDTRQSLCTAVSILSALIIYN